MKVIALYGYPRCGKDTVYKIIKGMYPDKKIVRVAYADKLKERHMEQLGITDRAIYDELLHGDELFNGLCLRTDIADLSERILKDNRSWNVDNVRASMSEHSDAGVDLVIITDTRYPIEFGYTSINNYPLVRVDRVDPADDVKGLRWNKYITCFDPDYIINNTHASPGDLLLEIHGVVCKSISLDTSINNVFYMNVLRNGVEVAVADIKCV